MAFLLQTRYILKHLIPIQKPSTHGLPMQETLRPANCLNPGTGSPPAWPETQISTGDTNLRRLQIRSLAAVCNVKVKGAVSGAADIAT